MRQVIAELRASSVARTPPDRRRAARRVRPPADAAAFAAARPPARADGAGRLPARPAATPRRRGRLPGHLPGPGPQGGGDPPRTGVGQLALRRRPPDGRPAGPAARRAAREAERIPAGRRPNRPSARPGETSWARARRGVWPACRTSYRAVRPVRPGGPDPAGGGPPARLAGGDRSTRLSPGPALLARRLARRGVSAAGRRPGRRPRDADDDDRAGRLGGGRRAGRPRADRRSPPGHDPRESQADHRDRVRVRRPRGSLAGGRMAQGAYSPTTPPAAEGQAPADPAPAARGATWLNLHHNDAIWIDVGVPHYKFNTLIPHPTTNCLACHQAPLAINQPARLRWALVQPDSPTAPCLAVQPAAQPHGRRPRRTRPPLAPDAPATAAGAGPGPDPRPRHGPRTAPPSSSSDATRNAVQAVDQALGKVRQDGKDSKAEIEAIDALLKHLQQRKAELQKPAEPKKHDPAGLSEGTRGVR